MTKNTSIHSYSQIRRQKRAKDDAWIQSFLERAPFGVMGTCREGQPFLVTRNFVYDRDAHAIYMHGARAGRTYENVQVNDRVCFSASEMGRLLPGEKANDDSITDKDIQATAVLRIDIESWSGKEHKVRTDSS